MIRFLLASYYDGYYTKFQIFIGGNLILGDSRCSVKVDDFESFNTVRLKPHLHISKMHIFTSMPSFLMSYHHCNYSKLAIRFFGIGKSSILTQFNVFDLFVLAIQTSDHYIETSFINDMLGIRVT